MEVYAECALIRMNSILRQDSFLLGLCGTKGSQAEKLGDSL